MSDFEIMVIYICVTILLTLICLGGGGSNNNPKTT